MLACLIACQVPQPSASHVRALVGRSPRASAPRPHGPSAIRLNPSRRGQLRTIRVSSQKRSGLHLPSPQLVCPLPQPRQSPPGGRSGPRPARSTTRPAGPKSERIVCTGQSVTSLSPSHQPGPRPAHVPSTARRSAPGSDPDPGPRLRHWPTSQYPMAVTARRLVSRHPSQYPEAHGPSVPRARLGGPCNVRPTRLSRRADAEPSDRRPSPASLSVPGATIRPPSIAGLRPALGQAPSTALQRPPGYRSRPRPAPPPLGAAALANTSGSGRKGAVEAVRDFIPQPPGCRQVTSLAPMAAWRLLPSSKKVWPLGPEDFWIDDATPWSRRSIGVTARRQARMRTRAHTARADQSRHARHDHGAHGSVTARTPRSRRARIGHGVHVSIAVRAARHGRHCGHSGPGGLGDATITARAAERVAKRRQAGAAEGRSSVARGDGDFGRASGRFTSGRYQHSEGLRPGPRARRLSEGRPATAVTAGTAADHGGHGADHDFRGADHSDPGDVERAAGPESAAAAAAAAAAITIPSEGLEVENHPPSHSWQWPPPPASDAGGVRCGFCCARRRKRSQGVGPTT